MKIKIRLGFDKELDGYDPDEVIAITFAEAKLNSIQARGGTLSNRFGVAKTANNKRVLGVLDEVRNQDNIPYQRHDCAVEVDGIPVFYGFALVEESSNRYYLRVYSGVSNFFELIGDQLISDLDLSAYDHTYNASTVNGKRSALDEVVYPNINQGLWTGDTLAARDFREFVPAVRVQTILAKSCTDQDYTLSGFTGDRYIPYSKAAEFIQTLSQGSTVRVRSTSARTIFQSIGATTENVYFDTTDSDPFSDASTITPGVGNPYTQIAPGAGSFTTRLTIDLEAPIGNSGDVDFVYGIYNRMTLSPGDTYSGTLEWTSEGTYFGLYSIDGAVADEIDIASGAIAEIIAYRAEIVSGMTVHTGGILPAIKTKDLFIQIATELNAILVVDPDDKTVDFVTFDSIAALYPVAKDWSAKLDYSDEPKIEFRLSDYGQNNYLNWTAGTEYDAAYNADENAGRGNLTISDSGIPVDVSLYTSKFAYSGFAEAFDEQAPMMLIPRYSGTGLSYDAPDVDPKPRIVTLQVNDTPLPSVQISGETAPGTQLEAVEESWQDFMDSNYTALSAALTKTKIAEVLVRLNAVDILELDFTKPVYILNEYWFIREVMQWKANRADSTIVKLLRL